MAELELEALHPKELEIYSSFKHEPRKMSYLLGRLSAKKAIYELTDFNELNTIFIDTAVFEFPVVKCLAIQNIQLSISHCNTIGLSIAFPESHPMGIDLEEVNTKNVDVLKDQMTLKEVQLVENLFLEEAKGYTLIWTAKEALSKIFKTGMMMDFKLLELDKVVKKGPIWESTFKHCEQYKAISYFSGTYVCSLVLPKYSTFNISKYFKIFKSLN
ncbi:4-phosphopantetheinyl transferase family protein [Kordia sp. YSTF-M3]|uniref:4-phosphopantetheinyl transferase family protein n=1 Tax=Kordia aestuariivivens TaxID=2759037 RepID=A0ABR7QE18_9FLAO|nr:4'-phosphopantetheinyl transferase superfamily protein [Kordia aestuariivivens]MBC8756559.1 4-phosphopantetheinyl transferase family protein [Kordia aestuariivivens]